MAVNVRTFNGSGDKITMAAGTAPHSGYGSFLAVLKSAADTGDRSLIAGANAGNTPVMELSGSQCTFWNGPTGAAFSGGNITIAMGWSIFGFSKGTGTVNGRFHKNVLSGPTVTHGNGTNPQANWAAETAWRLGGGNAGLYFSGSIYLVAYFDAAEMSDGQFAAITGVQDIINLSPTHLWILDQASTATAVTDHQGTGADQASISGTAVASDTIPNFTLLPTGRVYKRLTGPAQLTGSAADLYTCPASTTARILGIHASNPTGSPVDLNLSIGADAAATRVYDGYSLAADGVVSNFDPYDLAAGDTIQAWASSAGAVVLTVTGWEKGI